eukprot:365252-Chlamydomonas_euryale.AAC.24
MPRSLRAPPLLLPLPKSTPVPWQPPFPVPRASMAAADAADAVVMSSGAGLAAAAMAALTADGTNGALPPTRIPLPDCAISLDQRIAQPMVLPTRSAHHRPQLPAAPFHLPSPQQQQLLAWQRAKVPLWGPAPTEGLGTRSDARCTSGVRQSAAPRVQHAASAHWAAALHWLLQPAAPAAPPAATG